MKRKSEFVTCVLITLILVFLGEGKGGGEGGDTIPFLIRTTWTAGVTRVTYNVLIRVFKNVLSFGEIEPRV